jgi:type II secretory pathway pseudopilin PulG
MQCPEDNPARQNEEGFMLVGVIVLIFLVLLALSVAAPKVARGLRRDREVESIHRGNEYVRAIQLYYRKFGRYPGTMDQLEKSTNIRFLRQKYPDPMTGKADWRLIHIGEAKTTVKGFFGKPLAGLPGGGGGLGSASSMASGQPGSTVNGTQGAGSTGLGSSGLGSTSSSGGLSGSGSSSFSLGSGTSSNPGTGSTSGSNSNGTATVSSSSSGGSGSQSATSFSGGGAPIVGIGSSRSGTSITVLNEQITYQTWEFIYDPRIEQLKAKAALLGGGTNSGFGSGSSSGFGSSSPTSPMSPGSSSSPSGFGSSGSSGFGSGSSGSPSPSNPQ